MNSGHGAGPEDPQGTPEPPDASSQEDQGLEWTAWRQGPGYSRPVPPEPEPGRHADLWSPEESWSPANAGHQAEPGSHEKPPPRHPYEGRDPSQASGAGRADSFWAPPAGTPPSAAPPGVHEEPLTYRPTQAGDPATHRAPAPYGRGSYRPPVTPAEPTAYGAPPPAPYQRASYPPSTPLDEPVAYQAPSPYEEPGTYEVPKPRPYVDTGDSGALGHRYGETGEAGEVGEPGDPADHGEPGRYGEPGGYEPGHYDQPGRYEPEGYDEPAIYDEPGDFRPDDADIGAGAEAGEDSYRDFWEQGRGGGAHASPAGPARTHDQPPRDSGAPVVPPPPGDTSVYQGSGSRRQLAFLIAVAAVIVVAAVVSIVLLLSHHGPSRQVAGGAHPSATKATKAPTSPAPPPSPVPTPPLTGASGRLGVPVTIGSLRLNPALTDQFVGPSVKKKDANSFAIPHSDVVSGFYTSDPTATTYTAKDPRLMFLAAYLAGAGNPRSFLHEFMTNHTFTGQRQINPGPRGGVAACGLLPQDGTTVAHCMWADTNTYADFYAWNTTTSALAHTMIAIRPQVELTRH